MTYEDKASYDSDDWYQMNDTNEELTLQMQ